MRNLLLFLVLTGLMTACRRLPNVQGKGEASFQGIWHQDSIANSAQLLNYTRHQFKFTCDSFYVDMVTHSKVNYYSDSCFNNGVWKEYAKGVYAVRADSLFLEGTFTKANYKQKVSGCYQTGRFSKSFLIRSLKPDTIQLESINDQKDLVLNLKERIICEPKEL